MAYTEVREIPEKNEFFFTEMNIAIEESTHEITGRGFDSKRDEYHESTRELDSETNFVSCPLEKFYHEETGEEFTEDEVEELAQHGPEKVERTDIDEVRYVVDGEPYIAVYDVSKHPEA